MSNSNVVSLAVNNKLKFPPEPGGFRRLFCRLGIHRYSKWQHFRTTEVTNGKAIIGEQYSYLRSCTCCGNPEVKTIKNYA